MFFTRGFMKKIAKTKTTSENVEKSTKAKTKVNITYETDESVQSALREILVFIIFLVVTTIVANASQHLYMFFFNQTLERTFLERNLETDLGTEINFNDLVTVADWWLFMERIFLTNLHGLDYDWQNVEDATVSPAVNNETITTTDGEVLDVATDYKDANDVGTTTPNSDGKKNDFRSKKNSSGLTRIFLRDNVLLGPPRLRQIRVEEKSCEVNELFLTYFTNCYSGYTKSKENNTKQYKNSKFYTMSELQVCALRGQITTYYGAGFVTKMSYDLEENLNILENLKANQWIDRGTRLIILEFVLFNINSNIFDNAKILAEVPPVGGIVPSHQFQAIKFHSLWSEDDWVSYAAGIIFYVLALFYTIEKILQCKMIGMKLFFSSVWNLSDISILVLCCLSFIYNLIHSWYMNDIVSRAKINNQEFVSIDDICYWNSIYINMMAVCVFLVWIKIFKYISFNRTMSQFSTTLKRCAKDLFGFAVMFFIVFLAYAQLGLLIFGASHPDFRRFSVSVISLMRMFLGDFEYRLIEEANCILGPIYFLTYVVFVFFILLNMFLAIINDTYGAVKSEAHKSRSHLGAYLHRLIQKSYSWCIPKRKFKAEANESLLLKNISKLSPHSSDDEISTLPTSSKRVRKRASEILREYFEEISVSGPKADQDFQRLNKRIIVLEEVLEHLINNMDRILEKMESKKSRNRTKL